MENLMIIRDRSELQALAGTKKTDNSIYFSEYGRTRLLAAAEHAVATEITIKYGGKTVSVGIGDRNTDVLAALGAAHAGGVCIYPTIIRTKLDLARDPLEEGLTLAVKHEKSIISVPISNEQKTLAHIAGTYHNMIKKFAPSVIVAYHGMHRSYNTDVLLGFGHSHEFMGGKKNGFAFRRVFRAALNDELKKRGLEPMTVKIARSHFTGSNNYTLIRHVKEHNDATREKRMGVHVEFNRSGRVSANGLPSPEYQIAAQILAQCAKEWTL
ncbi:MAG: hypothetical protein HY365_00325 [Candidatus Aenigmarchaeota archaeon]|nr:hypothetical protein [Candidatus Aenigmarchaeota archaeon]